MSKIFIDTIIKYAKDLSDSDKVAVLDIVAKHVNKKMKKLEYDYKIKLKIDKLQENNRDCLPIKLGIQGIAQIDSPFRVQIPYYTNTLLEVPSPTISTVIAGMPLTPLGPILGVPGLAINPFSSSTSSFDVRIKKVQETLEIINNLKEKFIELKDTKMNDKDDLKKYFDYVDLDEDKPEEEVYKILCKKKVK
jgi:hypothetical protein